MASGRRLTPRGRERRDELLAYATRRFAQNGFHPTSVSDIVDGIGVGKGVFYWYFPSKDDLLLEIMRQALLDLRRCQQKAISAVVDPLQRLEHGIRASLAWSAANPDIMRLVMFCWTEESFAHALEKGRRIAIADTAKLVQAAIDADRIAPGDANLLATSIRGVTDELARDQVMTGTISDDLVVSTAIRMCLHGLGGPSGCR
ncbi:MAG: TetR/AcrR family transcriptional regulator [Actinomycetia bacterium]|nr:TetR/AcrR family transcriptional regulator [Actinomycetes bacterium]